MEYTSINRKKSTNTSKRKGYNAKTRVEKFISQQDFAFSSHRNCADPCDLRGAFPHPCGIPTEMWINFQ